MHESHAAPETREQRVRRLEYQSWYRGCRETDRILGWFARAHIRALDDAGLDMLEAIMAESDADLFRWVSDPATLPEKYRDNRVMRQLLAFDVAKACAAEAEGAAGGK